MKKLLLILRHDAKQFKNDRKYAGIINAFEKNEYNVSYTILANGKIVLCSADKKTVIGSYKETKLGKIYAKNIGVYKAIVKYCTSANKHFNLCYVRMMPATNAFCNMFKSLNRLSNKVVVEIPSYPIAEEMDSDKRIYRKVVSKYFLHNINKLSSYVNLYLVIGDKCSSYNGVRAINISNGIDLNEIPLRTHSYSGNMIHILALAKMARWHGYDRLIEGLKNYISKHSNPNIIVHFVGNDGDGSLLKWKQMTSLYGLDNNIIFEGSLYGAKLDKMFDLCDIAVASLGMHRKNAFTTSELKIREYCARGIPFIYSAEDVDLKSSCTFCRKVPLDDSAIDFDIIIDLFSYAKNNPNIIQEMRNYCHSFLSWDKVIERVLNSI